MRIELKGVPAFDVDLDGAGDVESAVERLASSPGMAAVTQAIGKGSYYARFETWSDMSDSTAKDIAQALFEEGPLGALGKIADMVQDANDSEPESRADEVMDGSGEFKGLVAALAEHLDMDEDDDEISDALKEALRAYVAEAMEAADDSKEADIVPSHVRVEVVHYFGMGELSPDDRYVQNVSNVFGPGTAVPDERLAAFFQGMNVDFEGFRDHVLADQGVDLRGGPGDEGLVSWLAEADYIGDRDRARERAVERAAAWKAFSPEHDGERPALLSHADAWTVLSESTGGGVPCFVARVPLAKLLDLDWETPLRFSPSSGYRQDTGGFAGIYDPVNGSGYIERAAAPVEIPAGTEGWRVSGRGGYAVDDTFGIVGTYYYADVEALPAPEDVPGMGM